VTAAVSIVSLIASATEIVCALGLRDRLVGISHECDFPDDVRGLPVCSEPKLDVHQSSGAIDRAVRDLVREGTGIYHVRTEALESLRPDLIVTQDQCDVCAVTLEDVERACSTLTDKAVRICSLRPNTLADIVADFRRVGASAGVSDRAERLVDEFERRLDALRTRTAGATRPRVLCLEWLDPPMVAGGWIPELVDAAGGTPVIVSEPTRFRTVGWPEIEAADAEVAIIMPCGYPIGRTVTELRGPDLSAPLRRLRATRTGRTFVADGNAYFNRPGPRIADSAEILAALFHPSLFPWPRAGVERWA
jgi:iron complex transport system substrate-binding protein